MHLDGNHVVVVEDTIAVRILVADHHTGLVLAVVGKIADRIAVAVRTDSEVPRTNQADRTIAVEHHRKLLALLLDAVLEAEDTDYAERLHEHPCKTAVDRKVAEAAIRKPQVQDCDLRAEQELRIVLAVAGAGLGDGSLRFGVRSHLELSPASPVVDMRLVVQCPNTCRLLLLSASSHTDYRWCWACCVRQEHRRLENQLDHHYHANPNFDRSDHCEMMIHPETIVPFLQAPMMTSDHLYPKYCVHCCRLRTIVPCH